MALFPNSSLPNLFKAIANVCYYYNDQAYNEVIENVKLGLNAPWYTGMFVDALFAIRLKGHNSTEYTKTKTIN